MSDKAPLPASAAQMLVEIAAVEQPFRYSHHFQCNDETMAAWSALRLRELVREARSKTAPRGIAVYQITPKGRSVASSLESVSMPGEVAQS